MKKGLALFLIALTFISIAFANEEQKEEKSFSKDLDFEKAKDFGGKILFKGEEYNLPNIVFTYTPIEYEGEGVAKRNLEFKNLTVDAGKEYKAKEETVNYDIGALWDVGHLKEKTEDRLDVRAGLSLRYIDYKFEVESENNKDEIKDHKIIPMLDIEAEVEVLPVNQNVTAEIILELQSYIWDGKFLFLTFLYKDGFF